VSWLVALVSLGLALLAQKITSDARVADNGQGAPPLISWVLYGLAALLFVLAVPGAPPPAEKAGTPFIATLRAMRRRSLFLALAGGALLCSVAAGVLFFSLNSTQQASVAPWPANTGSWILYLASLLLFGAAWIVWERNRPNAESGSRNEESETASAPSHRIPNSTFRIRIEWLVIVALTVLALALRVINLDSAPPGLWFDEAQNGIVARSLYASGAAHPTFIGDFTQLGALYFYVLGLVLKLLGETLVWPVRLLPALAGAALVPMIYLLGSRLYGWRVGLAAAALLAVSGWNITFSRFGMASLPTVALDVAAILCLVQALRTGRLGYYAAGGLLIGFALQMYYVAELVPVILGLVFLHRLITGRMRFWRNVRAGIAVLAVSAVVAFLPVATFAVQHPQVFMQRAGTVNIFSPEGSDNNPNALSISLNKHALMFNYAGDNNGRHNLPGDPMLDWWTGALFIAGLGVCLLRIRRWHYFFPLVWFLVALSGGVLSIVFEAPQAHRTVENSVVTALIAGIFLGEVCGALMSLVRRPTTDDRRKMAGPLRLSSFVLRPSSVGLVSLALLVAVLALAGADNIDHYFNRQLNTQGVWLDMLGQDRAIADDLVQYGNTHVVYVSDAKANYQPSIYRAPNVPIIPWPSMSIFPLTNPKDTEIILTDIDSRDIVSIKRAYPNARVDVVYGPNRDQPQIFQINVPAGDISGLRGVREWVYGKDPGKPVAEQVLSAFQLDPASLAQSQASQASSVRLSSTLKTDSYGKYSFRWQGPDGKAAPGQVLVDGFDATASSPITLATGLHSVVVSSTIAGASGTDQLLMAGQDGNYTPIGGDVLFDSRKIQPHGLTANFRQGTDFNAPVVLSRIDSNVSFFFHITPLPRAYTGEWVGKIYIPTTGTYTFYTEQISQSHLQIDGKELISNSGANSMESAAAQLTAGLHDIRLLFLDQDGFSHVYLYWTPPGMSGQFIIPSAFLLPVRGTYADEPESGKWPTLDEADDSVWANSAEAGMPNPAPAQTSVQQSPATGSNSQSTPQQVQQPASQAPAPTAGGTAPNEIQPVLVLGKGDGSLNRPKAAAVDADGNMYIYTETDTSISKFGPDGKPIKKWDVHEADGKPATEISAMVVKDGKLLALDAATSDLITYNLDGTGGDRKRLCSCFFARGMSVSNDGNLWVTDTGNNRVIKIGPEGTVLAAVDNGKGSNPGQFVEPAGAWQAPDGTLFVTDVTNQRVQSFTPDLKPIAAWPMGKSTPRDGNRVVADDKGALVTEYESAAVIRYDAQGKELSRWVYHGTANPSIPAAITPAGKGKFLVLYPYDNLAVLFTP
jgi:hypothetical protein